MNESTTLPSPVFLNEHTQPPKQSVWQLLTQPLKRMKRQYLLAAMMAAVYGVSRGFGIPIIIKLVFSQVFREGSGAISLTMLIFYCALPALTAVVQGISYFLSIYLMQSCAVEVMASLRQRFFEQLQYLPLRYFHKNPSGSLIARGLQDTTIVQTSFQQVMLDLLRHPTTLLGACGYLVYLCWQKSDILFLLLFLGALPISVFMIRFVGRRLRLKAQSVQQEVMNLSERLSQNLSAVREIRAFQLEAYELELFEKSTRWLAQAQLKVVKYTYSVGPMVEAMAALGIGVALGYTYFHKIAFDEFSSLCLALYLCYAPLKELGQLHAKVQESRVSLERIQAVINEPITETDPEHAIPIGRAHGALRFENVYFSYEPGTPVLKGLSTTLEAGKTYALVGPSGAGKSTFVQLLLRFYSADSGGIFLDDIFLQNLKIHDLRRQIAFVPQDPVLFNDTIYNNIRIGNLKASKEAIEHAAQQAYAHDFILKQEAGYDTQVGERGCCLSGGQRQRIALARAFLRNAPILILDEATSALDTQNEELVQKALKELCHGKTVLIIAHRFSTIKNADSILVFQDGQILAQGPHSELITGCPLYGSLFAGTAS